MRRLAVSAPGRICLFGEHQDFLGLPVVAAAIDLRIRIWGVRRKDSLLRIGMPNIRRQDEIDLSGEIDYRHSRDYLRSCINVLRRKGWGLTTGYDCRMSSSIPIRAGVSSSSAMIVAWLKFLVEATGDGEAFSPEDIARLAHEAEVLEFGEPGGMMDHFASALGGMIYVDSRPPFQAETLPLLLDGFVLGDSLEKKQTIEVLSNSKSDVHEGIRFLTESYPGFDLHSTPASEIESLLDAMPGHISMKVRANLVNRDLTVQALKLFREGVDPVALGELLSRHHEQLRDGIGVSTPKIDGMLDAALSAGALGGKINGSGGGGCMFAYAPGREHLVVEAVERAGGRAHILTIDTGARLEAVQR